MINTSPKRYAPLELKQISQVFASKYTGENKEPVVCIETLNSEPLCGGLSRRNGGYRIIFIKQNRAPKAPLFILRSQKTEDFLLTPS